VAPDPVKRREGGGGRCAQIGAHSGGSFEPRPPGSRFGVAEPSHRRLTASLRQLGNGAWSVMLWFVRRGGGVFSLLLIGSFLAAGCSSSGPSAPSASSQSTSTAPTGLTVHTYGIQYTKDVAPLNAAIAQWRTAYAQLNPNATVGTAVIASVEDPLISALQSTVSKLTALTPPASIQSDIRNLIAGMAAYVGDLRGVVDSWPTAQSEITQAEADQAKMNSASALVDADLHQQN
jgi:hypothetical protein